MPLKVLDSFFEGRQLVLTCHNVPKFSDARKLCCNLPKIQTERPNLRGGVCCWGVFFGQNDANDIANSENLNSNREAKS